MMRIRLAVALLLVLVVGCSRSSHPTARGNGLKAWKADPGAPQNGVLHLRATYTAPYCGGADPGPDGMPKPGPWQGRLFLRMATPDSSGAMAPNDLKRPLLDTLRTGPDGQAHVALPAGTYLLLDRDRVDDGRYKQLLRDHAKPGLYTEPIDKACLDRWLYGPFGVVAITPGDTTHITLDRFDRCPWYNTPCVAYHGPLPP